MTGTGRDHRTPARRWRRHGPLVLAVSHHGVTAGTLASASGVVFDAEPFLVDWSEPAQLLPDRARGWRRDLQVPVVVCSNSRRFTGAGPGVRLVHGARKPWTRLSRLGDLGPDPVVVGDLLVLDGLLARRLGATFLWSRPSGHVPLWPRLLGLADSVLVRFVTVPARAGRRA